MKEAMRTSITLAVLTMATVVTIVSEHWNG